MDHSAWVAAWKTARPRAKTKTFDQLLKEVNDFDMAEIIWIYWGENSLSVIDYVAPAINPNRKWWQFYKSKNTIRSLLKTERGREDIWNMLSDASAWM
jgi:hypothetical protein